MADLTDAKRRSRKGAAAIPTGRPAAAEAAPGEARWLLLFHQIPPNPAYVRVKIGRRLARIGAISLKNTIYVLPRSEAALEDLQWVLREVVSSSGEATLCEARFVDGLTDREIERRFQDARDEDYLALANEARELMARFAESERTDFGEDRLKADLVRFDRRLEEIASIDFFDAPAREPTAALLRSLRDEIEGDREPGQAASAPGNRDGFRGKVWVTRAGVHVDRIASAWLVRRYVDSNAEFKFVPPRGYRPQENELRFDMFDAEFTHEGDLCTFEVLLKRLAIAAPGLTAIAEVIHDIDVKDSKFERPETAGVAALIVGLCSANRSDEARLAQGFSLFDQLQSYFSKRKSAH
ncbi:MAG TPA: chromate resistance protein ChrB domain-containing protein [Polyangiaceae bacterium]|jgi:hypothetical protein|nr:chromate resistance protein ChrB domain-containing protein [Polyangiaceae bacterium]